MLRQRTLSAIVIVVVAVVPAVLGHPVLTAALIALAGIGVVEFSRAVRTIDVQPLIWIAVALSALLILVTGIEAPTSLTVAVLVIGSISVLIVTMLRGVIVGATRNYAYSIAPVIYIGLPLAHMPLIRTFGADDVSDWLQSLNNLSLLTHPAEGLGWLILIVAITWMTDSAAYLGGRAFGRNKLAPVLSPGKTIEGALAGIITGALTGAFAAWLLGLPVPLYVGAGLGLIISALGQTGDLAESLIKRDLGIKDMGHLIPGHGGILDRIDALLFTLPAGYYLILLVTEVRWP